MLVDNGPARFPRAPVPNWDGAPIGRLLRALTISVEAFA